MLRKRPTTLRNINTKALQWRKMRMHIDPNYLNHRLWSLAQKCQLSSPRRRSTEEYEGSGGTANIVRILPPPSAYESRKTWVYIM
jgi:hypothetical protein